MTDEQDLAQIAQECRPYSGSWITLFRTREDGTIQFVLRPALRLTPEEHSRLVAALSVPEQPPTPTERQINKLRAMTDRADSRGQR